jgi:heme-degrading monooxygenase HmoA
VIREHAVIDVQPGTNAAFEAAYTKARLVLLASPSAHTAVLSRCVEEPSRYLLLVEWDTLEAHTETFRGSPAFTAWRALIGPYFANPPDVTHYAEV